MPKKHVEKEWNQLLRAEQMFLKKNMAVKNAGWQEKLSEYVPEKLEDTLKTAFYKAFGLIFEKGTGVIEKTYQREKKEQDYKIHAYTAAVRGSRHALRAFGREAFVSKSFNVAISAAEGVGMGILGMGIPDIPIFLGVLLKNIYEIALSYGFSYDTREEQMFILKLIEAALSHERELVAYNAELDAWIANEHVFAEGWEEQLRRTADALSRELLYLKFVQGMPIVGVIGGLSDMVYQKKIGDFAALKYKKRFLEAVREE